jgi:hypothetical protein
MQGCAFSGGPECYPQNKGKLSGDYLSNWTESGFSAVIRQAGYAKAEI